MKQYRITLDGHTFDVQVLSDPRQDEVEVEVNGTLLTVQVEAGAGSEPNPEVAPLLTGDLPSASKAAATAVKTVTAPLPGTIKSVAVQPDQPVVTGEKLVVIEAMKMNNVIGAPRDGVIGAIHVTEGRQVAHGELLVEYRD